MGLTIDRHELWSLLGYVPHAGQRAMHDSLARYRVMACGVRWGKSTSAAHEALAMALEPRPRGCGWIVGPNYDLGQKVWREVVHLLHARLPQLVIAHREHEHYLSIHNLAGGTCEIRLKSADSPVSLLGEGLDWLVLDEAAQVRPDIWERYLMARLLDKRGRGLLISTPKGKGWFHGAFRRGQRGVDSDYASWNSPTWENPIIRKDDIERIRASTPEALFRQEYGAEFIEGAGSVFRFVRERATGGADAGAPYTAGLDLARVQDYTVLVVMDSERRVVHWERWTRVDWSQQVARIAHALERYGRPLCYVDSTGAGEPVYETLLEAGVNVEGYPFTAQSKAALVNNLAIMLERGEIVLPQPEAWPELIDELEAFQYSVTDAGNVRTGSPPGMHDDCVCALMLAAWGARDTGEYEIQEV